MRLPDCLASDVPNQLYHNAENGFCVLRTKARGHRDLVTVVGHSATIAAGKWITATGEWVNEAAWSNRAAGIRKDRAG
jgi:exodeoxyribonuclease V alpha subunit